jgi:hypothetical protein
MEKETVYRGTVYQLKTLRLNLPICAGPTVLSYNMRQTSEAKRRRPLLHHLNADSSWLLQIPRPQQPASSKDAKEPGYFSILIDPWLDGPQSDVATWFSTQSHAIPSKYQTIKQVEDLARQNKSTTANTSPIDAVVISHEFSDHCHKETLLEISSAVPVFAPDKAYKLISSWKHFRLVIETPVFGSEIKDWHRLTLKPLPDWIAITRIIEAKNALYYHSAITVIFDSSHESHEDTDSTVKPEISSGKILGPGTSTAPSTEEAPEFKSKAAGESKTVSECVVYTPHGIAPSALHATLMHADPQIQTLCLLHGMHDLALPVQQLNLGAQNGLQVQRSLMPKYWVATHDEVKKGGGLVAIFLRRNAYTLDDALGKEASVKAESNGGSSSPINFIEVDNGQSIVLD